METRAAKGGRTGPGNWMNSACISTGCHGSGGGGRRGDGPFPFKDLAAQASMRKAPEAWAPGIQESRPPVPPSSQPGAQAPHPLFRPENPASQPLSLRYQ